MEKASRQLFEKILLPLNSHRVVSTAEINEQTEEDLEIMKILELSPLRKPLFLLWHP